MAVPADLIGVLVLLALVATVLVVAVLAFVGEGSSLASGDEDPVVASVWRAEASALASRLESDLEALESPVDPDRVQRTVLPVAGQFERLARKAPAGVDEPLARRVYDLGVACRRLGIERAGRGTTVEDPILADAVSELAAEAAGLAQSTGATAVDRDR